MALLLSGGSGPRELSPILRVTEKGEQTIRRWRGTYADLRVEAANHAGHQMQLVEESEIWFLLEVTYEGWPNSSDPSQYPSVEDQIVTLYNLRGSKVGKSIWDLPKVRAELDKVRDFSGPLSNLQGVAKLRSDLIALARGDSVVFEAPTGSEHGQQKSARQVVVTLDGIINTAASAGVSATVIRGLFGELARGVEGRTLDAFLLRRRAVGPVNADLLQAYLEMNQPLTTDTLKSRLPDIPYGISRVMPAGYWFAGAPNLDQSDANRLELVQEWQHTDEYSTFMFGDPT